MAIPERSDWVNGATNGRLTWGGTWVDLDGILVPPSPARLDGVMWGITARDAQAVADIYGCQLLTPLMSDEIRSAAVNRFDFEADASSGTAAMMGETAMRRYSASLLAKVEDVDDLELTDFGAKDWVLTKGLQDRVNPYTGAKLAKNWACNYGAYHSSGKGSVSGNWKVIQSAGYAHNDAHRDYSQLLRLAYVPRHMTMPSHDGCTSRRLHPRESEKADPNLAAIAIPIGLILAFA